MLKLIIEKELKEIILSTKFAVAFGTCAILILLTFYIGAKNYQVNKDQYEASKTENLRQMEKLTDWLTISHRIFLPPQPLAVLVTGISNDIGRNISILGRGELNPEDSRYNNDPIYAVFRFLDLEFLFQIILSLFAILFAYNAINGEKEAGTLRLTFSNSIPRSTYILGKLIGSFISLIIPLLIPMLFGCLLLPILGVNLNSEEWIKLILIIITGLLYFGVFLTLSILISTIFKNSSSSFLISIVVWIFFVLIIPRVSVLIAGRAVYVPSVDEIQSQKTRFNMQANNEIRDKMKNFKSPEGGDFMKEFQTFMKKISEERDKKTMDFAKKINEERYNRQKVQESVSFNLARISPAAVFSFAISDMAGTSLRLKDRYLQQAVEYQTKFAEFQKQKTGGETSSGGIMIRISDGNSERQKTIDVKELPEFNFKSEPLSEIFGKALVDICLLIIYNIIFFAGSFIFFKKYDLR